MKIMRNTVKIGKADERQAQAHDCEGSYFGSDLQHQNFLNESLVPRAAVLLRGIY